MEKKDPISVAFKKLLGNGRAWLCVDAFTSEFIDVIVSPLIEAKNCFKNFKYVHFPTLFINENNIKNGEEMFNIKDGQGKSLTERASNIEAQWNALSGSQNYKPIENLLRKRGFPVSVIENIPSGQIDMYGARSIGNGYLLIENELKDPISIIDGKHSFIIKFDDFLTNEQIDSLIETLVKTKPAHNGVFVVPRFLRKKEIHKVLTKSQMQQYRKSQYCDCRKKGGF